MAFGELVKSLIVRFTTDGAEETKLEIDDISEKVFRLTHDDHNISVGIDDGGLTAKLAAMRAEIGAFADSMHDKLTDSMSSGWGGFLSKLGKIPFIGSFLSGLGGLGQGGGALSGLLGPTALAGLAVGIIGVVGAILEMVPALVAAGLGIGAFAALAIPTFSKIYDAITNVKGAWKLLDEPQRDIVQGIRKIEAEFQHLAYVMEPIVTKLAGIGVGIVQKLMPFLEPLAKAAGGALVTLAGQLEKAVGSKGFKDFMDLMIRLTGPSILALGHGIGMIAAAFGHLLEAITGKNAGEAPHVLGQIVDGIAHVINGIADMITWLKTWWDENNNALKQMARDFANWYHDVSGFIGRAVHDIAAWSRDTGRFLAQAWGDFEHFLNLVNGWIGKIEHWFLTLPTHLLHNLETLVTGLFALGQRAMQGLLSGLKSMVGGIISAAASWGHDILNAIGSPFGIHFSDPSEALTVIKAGHRIGEGLAKGMLSSTSLVMAASRSLYSAAGWGPGMTGGTGAYAGGGVHVTVNFNGVVGDPNAVARQIQQLLLRLARDRGYRPNTSAGLGLA